eukprot:351130-Chlamydomonas_euryale.AAC.2
MVRSVAAVHPPCLPPPCLPQQTACLQQLVVRGVATIQRLCVQVKPTDAGLIKLVLIVDCEHACLAHKRKHLGGKRRGGGSGREKGQGSKPTGAIASDAGLFGADRKHARLANKRLASSLITCSSPGCAACPPHIPCLTTCHG